MNDPIGGKKPANRMIWLLGLVVLFAVFAFMFARPLGELR
jgi:preprotein translocase subunit YajC